MPAPHARRPAGLAPALAVLLTSLLSACASLPSWVTGALGGSPASEPAEARASVSTPAAGTAAPSAGVARPAPTAAAVTTAPPGAVTGAALPASPAAPAVPATTTPNATPTPTGTVIAALTPAPSATAAARRPRPSAAAEAKAYRQDAAEHLYAANRARIFPGKLPPLLYAIGVLDVEVDAQGEVRGLSWQRAPRHAPEVIAEIERTVRASAPYPAPARMGRVVYTDVWLWDKSGRFQLDTLSEGQN